tara:strand:+ start:2476 stop:2775 length:300 start_codon:yes stop_codon:yes gene_type:complete
MQDYHFSEKGEFTRDSFFEEIRKAKTFLVENYSQKGNTFKETRHSYNIVYTISEVEYSGEYIIYEIRNRDNHIGNLQCFLSKENNYMEVILQRIYSNEQ